MVKKSCFIAACTAVVLALACNDSHADWTQTMSVSQPDNGFGLPISASVMLDFDSGSGLLSVTLDNLIVDPTSVNQNLSGLFLSFTTGESIGSLVSSSGVERTIAGDGSYLDGAAVATGWALFDDVMDPLFGTTGLHLSVLGMPTAPAHTIIGLPDISDEYGSANHSLAGNRPHNPFLGESAIFLLDVEGLSEATRVSRATFQFNTSAGTYAGVPEPGCAILLAIGLAGLIARRR